MTLRGALWPLALLAAASAQAEVAGRVLTSEGRPVAGATVSALASETTEARARRLVAGFDRRALLAVKSAADGTFHLAGEDPVMPVAVRAEGYAPGFATGLRGEELTVSLTPAAVRRGTVLALGKPVAEATLLWTAGDGEVIVRSGKDGSYEIPDPEGWAGGLTVLHRDFAPLVAAPRDGKWAELRHALLPGTALRGRVVEERTGRGVGGATIWLDGWPRAESTADGSFVVAHAAADWTVLGAQTPTLVGSTRPGPGAVVIALKPARRLVGSVRETKTKQPLAGVQVTVQAASAWGPSATTNARGEYEIFPLPSARYYVYAARPGFAPGPSQGEDSMYVDLRKAETARHDFELGALPRVSGRVQDEKGRPVESALVVVGAQGMGTAYGSSDLLSGMYRRQEATLPLRTGRDGGFSLVLPEGEDFIGLQPQLVALKSGYAAGTAKPPAAGTGGPLVIVLPRGITLTGRVQTQDGAPLADVGIAVGETGPLLSMSTLLGSNTDDTDWARSDAAGRFSIQVNPVPHQLSLHKPGFAPRIVEAFDPRGGQELRVVLDPGAEVRGQLVRHDGQGIAGAMVTLADASEKTAGTTLTLLDGTFVLGDLAPGPYVLSATTTGASGATLQRSVSAPAQDVRIELGPTGSVRGRVTDAATRSPLPRFSVNVHAVVEPAPDQGMAADRGQQIASPDGAFVMEDVVLGESVVTVSAEGYRTKTIEGVTVSAGPESPDIEVALESGLVVRGRVTGSDGQGLADVAVSASSDGESQRAATDENGDYELTAVAPGEAAIDFKKDGFRSVKRTVPLQQAARVDVTLSRGLSLQGVVVSGDAGAAGVQVHATSSAADAEGQSTRTDASGRFTLPGLGPGRYEVVATAEQGGKAELHDVDAQTAGPLRLVLERTPTAVLTGTVTGLGATAARPAMVLVQVQSEEGYSAQQGMVDVAGAFRIEQAPAGRVTVVGEAISADGSTRASLPRELTLAAGSETATVVEFHDELVISGTVVRSGAGLPGVTVSFQGGRNNASTSRTDFTGHYQVSVAAGPYTVNLSQGGVAFDTSYVATETATFDIDVTGGTLRGRVVEAGTDTAVSGVEVTLWPVGGTESSPASSVQSSGQGAFEATSLREGRYRVLTAKNGYGQQVREVEIQTGATAELLLELQPADGVRVKVVDARDNRTLDAIVVVRDPARRIVANKHGGADKDGTVTVALADGPYLLSASSNGYGTVTLPITAPAPGLGLALTPGGTLVVESPRNLRGRIRLVQPDGDDYVSCWCNGIADILVEGRRTTVEHITPGRYTLVLVDVADAAPRPVEIREGAVASVTIE